MNHVHSTGPGLFSIKFHEKHPEIPEGITRCYFARIEIYDYDNGELFPKNAIPGTEITLTHFPALSTGHEDVPEAMLLLGQTIQNHSANLSAKVLKNRRGKQ